VLLCAPASSSVEIRVGKLHYAARVVHRRRRGRRSPGSAASTSTGLGSAASTSAGPGSAAGVVPRRRRKPPRHGGGRGGRLTLKATSLLQSLRTSCSRRAMEEAEAGGPVEAEGVKDRAVGFETRREKEGNNPRDAVTGRVGAFCSCRCGSCWIRYSGFPFPILR
jgi:hypothetical protein